MSTFEQRGGKTPWFPEFSQRKLGGQCVHNLIYKLVVVLLSSLLFSTSIVLLNQNKESPLSSTSLEDVHCW